MSTETIESRSPQDQGDVVVTTAAADRETVADAFAHARSAFGDWGRGPSLARADALSAAAAKLEAAGDEVVDLIVREVGKPRTEAVQELGRSVRILRYQAQAALDPDGDTYPTAPPADPRTLLLSRRKPRGVAGLITPWNFPFAIPLWKAAPALAYGNTVVLKPSPDATACALYLEELLASVLPEHVFTVTPGLGEAGQALVELADVVSFTGSTTVGLQVARAAAERAIACQCEMGGSNASIILPDANMEGAAKAVAAAAMGFAGQKCTATSRVITVGAAGDAFGEALTAAVGGMVNGDPASADTTVGPLINAPALEKVVDAARAVPGDGGRVLTGGSALDGPGLFVGPTVVDGQTPDARLAREEVFGPITTILRADSAEQAVAISNAVPYGLVTSVFTSDLDRALTAIEGIDTGMVRVNMPTSGVDFHAPFGGEKQSSYGPREQGKAAREIYTTTHTITVGPAGS